jgi:hypothetical protein
MMRWETLFARALLVLDCAASAGTPVEPWTFGGGTALMWRYRHRVSKDIDIFVPDPQLLGRLSPRLNPAVDALTSDYVEQASSLKLYFPEGSIDFVVSGSLTPHPFTEEKILGRPVRVETAAEIVAKKLWHRAASFTARDLFDLAFVAERGPAALPLMQGILALRREDLTQRLNDREKALREDFEALETLDFAPSFDDCVRTLRALLARASLPGPPRAEQELARYERPRRPSAAFPAEIGL